MGNIGSGDMSSLRDTGCQCLCLNKRVELEYRDENFELSVLILYLARYIS